MHSRIFEIKATPVNDDEWASESAIADEDYNVEGTDYFEELDNPEERVEDIEAFFLKVFPGNSFKVISNEPEKTACVEFVGNINALYEMWYEYVKNAFNQLDKNMGTMDVFRLRLACKEPFDLGAKFYLEEWSGCTESAESFMEWLKDLSRNNDGKPFKLYIGQVFDYHY